MNLRRPELTARERGLGHGLRIQRMPTERWRAELKNIDDAEALEHAQQYLIDIYTRQQNARKARR
jgi:hypothetical protein